MNRTPRFNLVDEPWLPCIERHTRRPVRVGLREVLVRAHELQELMDPSPLVTAALHRLLLAVLHRILGPPTLDAWLDMWRARRWDPDPISAYLDQWRARFDLFDPSRPFYQTTSVAEEYATTPATKLLLELASGNNATLFDHTVDHEWRPLDPARAARAVITFQAFAPGGLVSFETGMAQHRSANAAPLARGAMVLVRGETLFDTLELNLVRYDLNAAEPPGTTPRDRPAWESDAQVVPEERVPLGHLDYLTWQSRRLRLIPELDDTGQIVVRRVVLMKGAQIPKDYSAAVYEQMLAFRRRNRPGAANEAFVPVGFSEDRAFWRDTQALLDTFSSRHALPPRTVQWLHEVAAESGGELDDGGDRLLALDLLGLSGERAKPLFWRHERLPLPLAYLRDPYLVQALARTLRLAEDGGRALQRAVYRLATLALVSDASQGGREPDLKLVASLVTHLDTDWVYWSSLEVPFKRLLVELPANVEGDGYGYGSTMLPEWQQRVRRAARTALLAATSGFDGNGRSLKAATAGEQALEYWLATLLGLPQTPEGEVAGATN
jgi:CRISPR system Cascade subunit CasA